MRNMSFYLTEQQFLDGTKTVTRRLGWQFLKPGDRVRAVRGSLALKRGEKVHVLGVIEVIAKWRERLDTITLRDVHHEGFPDMVPREFVAFFCKEVGATPETEVTRIEFKRIEDPK